MTGIHAQATPIGQQRDWVWRGWQVRYTYLRNSTNITSEKPPLIFLHGFGASIGHWRHNLPAFSQNHTVYALDLLGFGASQKTSANYNSPFWAEQVHDFWQTFIQKPTILIGNSIGSLVSMTAAATYPQMVQGIVMINLPDSSVLSPPRWAQPMVSTLNYCLRPVVELTKQVFTCPLIFEPFFQIIRHPKVLKAWTQKAYADPTIVGEELIRLFAEPCYDQGAAGALRAMINSTSGNSNPYTAKTILPQLKLPILLIWGRQDMMVPSKLAPLFTDYNPKLQLIEIDHAGHCPHDECPEKVNQSIIAWINSHIPIETQHNPALFSLR